MEITQSVSVTSLNIKWDSTDLKKKSFDQLIFPDEILLFLNPSWEAAGDVRSFNECLAFFH